MNFYEFIKLNFLFFGIDVDQKFSSSPQVSRILKLWQFLNPILMIIGSIQLWMNLFLLLDNGSILELPTIAFGIIFVVNGFAGYFTVIATQKLSIRLIQNVEIVFTKITKNHQQIENNEIVKNVFSSGLKFHRIITGSVVLNLALTLMKIIMAMATSSGPGNLSVMLLWFPEFLQNSWVFIAVYDPLMMLLFCLSNLFAPELNFITSAYLAASFDKLGDKLKEVIDGTETRSFLDTKRKLVECVDIHSELIKLADESNRLYGPYNLIFLILISMKICMMGIMIMVIILRNICLFT